MYAASIVRRSHIVFLALLVAAAAIVALEIVHHRSTTTAKTAATAPTSAASATGGTADDPATTSPHPSRNRDAGAAASSSPSSASSSDAGAQPDEGFIDDPKHCEDVCGSECEKGAANRLRCPKTCMNDTDCGSGTFCSVTRMPEGGGHIFRCLGSECGGPGAASGTKGACPAGSNCVLRGLDKDETPMFRCTPGGDRKAGEACADVDYAGVGRCGPNLDCMGGRCYPTSCADDKDCPSGSQCHRYDGKDASRRLCGPMCETNADCGGGRCVTIWGQASCVDADQPKTCLESGCAAGETCVVEHHVPWDTRAICAKVCAGAGDDAACGSGQFCGAASGVEGGGGIAFRCYPPCGDGAAKSAAACPDGWKCAAIGEGGKRGCVFDVLGATDAYLNGRYR